MKKVKILDCTLRDGGYYNDWDFDLSKSKDVIKSLNEAKVDMIELGYKSCNVDEYYGPFKYCNEELLSFISPSDYAEYAFMIDAKEFISGDSINTKLLDKCIKPRSESIFSWVRIASRVEHMGLSSEFIDYFKSKGYSICYNLMGGSTISDSLIINVLDRLEGSELDIFYIADSYGSFYPSDIRDKLRLINQHYSGALGIHLHDNQGMAYANAIVAIEEGVEIVDATIMGMGRGAGNLVLEQFLLGYKEKYEAHHLRPEELLPCIDSYFRPLHEKYRWGFNYVYMLSGLNNIHQSYCQKLSQTNRYTPDQISKILSDIPENKRLGYTEEALSIATQTVFKFSENENKKKFELFNQPLKTKDVLVVANGPSLEKHSEVLKRFANKKGMTIFECNNTGKFKDTTQRILVILNKLKLEDFLEENEAYPIIVTGETYFPIGQENRSNIYRIPFSLGDFDSDQFSVTIPDYDAGMFAIGCAINSGVKNIYLAGFDGFDDGEKNKNMNSFFSMLTENFNLTAITPTEYQHLRKSSVYGLL